MSKVINPDMYRCRECEKYFDEYQIKTVYEEYEGWGRTFVQEYAACPYCLSTDIVESCGENDEIYT